MGKYGDAGKEGKEIFTEYFNGNKIKITDRVKYPDNTLHLLPKFDGAFGGKLAYKAALPFNTKIKANPSLDWSQKGGASPAVKFTYGDWNLTRTWVPEGSSTELQVTKEVPVSEDNGTVTGEGTVRKVDGKTATGNVVFNWSWPYAKKGKVDIGGKTNFDILSSGLVSGVTSEYGATLKTNQFEWSTKLNYTSQFLSSYFFTTQKLDSAHGKVALTFAAFGEVNRDQSLRGSGVALVASLPKKVYYKFKAEKIHTESPEYGVAFAHLFKTNNSKETITTALSYSVVPSNTKKNAFGFSVTRS